MLGRLCELTSKARSPPQHLPLGMVPDIGNSLTTKKQGHYDPAFADYSITKMINCHHGLAIGGECRLSSPLRRYHKFLRLKKTCDAVNHRFEDGNLKKNHGVCYYI